MVATFGGRHRGYMKRHECAVKSDLRLVLRGWSGSSSGMKDILGPTPRFVEKPLVEQAKANNMGFYGRIPCSAATFAIN